MEFSADARARNAYSYAAERYSGDALDSERQQMSGTHLSPAAIHVRAFSEAAQETWKRDHATAMECHDLEALLRLGISAHGNLVAEFRAWAADVIAGTANYDAARHAAVADELRTWLGLVPEVSAWIDGCRRAGYAVEHVAEFERCRSAAVRMLDGADDPLRVLRGTTDPRPLDPATSESVPTSLTNDELDALAAHPSAAALRLSAADEDL
jgi:hypothetical protein